MMISVIADTAEGYVPTPSANGVGPIEGRHRFEAFLKAGLEVLRPKLVDEPVDHDRRRRVLVANLVATRVVVVASVREVPEAEVVEAVDSQWRD